MALDEGDDMQRVELYARFGRAFYMANVVEDQLVLTLLQLEFARTKEAFVKAKGQGFDRAKVAADWDAFEKKKRGDTMGGLRNFVKGSADFDEPLKKRIDDAKERRDFLAHHYWKKNAEKMQTEEGRDEMIAELIDDADTFEKLAADIEAAMKPVREKLGIKDEALNKEVEKQLAQQRESQGLPLK